MKNENRDSHVNNTYITQYRSRKVYPPLCFGSCTLLESFSTCKTAAAVKDSNVNNIQNFNIILWKNRSYLIVIVTSNNL